MKQRPTQRTTWIFKNKNFCTFHYWTFYHINATWLKCQQNISAFVRKWRLARVKGDKCEKNVFRKVTCVGECC